MLKDTTKEAVMAEFVRLEIHEGVGTIRLDRPKMKKIKPCLLLKKMKQALVVLPDGTG